ncbi:MAG TPA: hypothetical protein DDZ97_07645 [Deltaproteobacteria bacterium]|nr:hypothetical protein [Deltaproteobacteria bacterium]|tara:strand:+ start:3237 stop:3689 length:453 start_codon:yes stop_codon:yes gene_type:complete
MTIKIERLSIQLRVLKVSDIKEFVFQESLTKFVQIPFRALFICKVILVILIGLIFPQFGFFVTEAKAQMEGNYSQPACQEFLEPTNPAELKLLRECAKQQRDTRVKKRKEEIRLLRTASASFLSESLGGPSGEIMPVAKPDDANATAASQ